MTDEIRPPWSEQQVAALNAFQRSGRMHPFTCGGEHRMHQTLIAEADGWHCPDETCDYRQNWAHPWMADPNYLTAMQFPGVTEHLALLTAARRQFDPPDGPAQAELVKVRLQLRATEFDLGQERQRNVVLSERLAAEEKVSAALRVELRMLEAARKVPAQLPDPDGGLCDAEPIVRDIAEVPTRGWL